MDKKRDMSKQKKKPELEQAASATSDKDHDAVQAAHDQAERDIEHDPEVSMHSPNDDLDEGELARLGEDGGPVE